MNIAKLKDSRNNLQDIGNLFIGEAHNFHGILKKKIKISLGTILLPDALVLQTIFSKR